MLKILFTQLIKLLHFYGKITNLAWLQFPCIGMMFEQQMTSFEPKFSRLNYLLFTDFAKLYNGERIEKNTVIIM